MRKFPYIEKQLEDLSHSRERDKADILSALDRMEDRMDKRLASWEDRLFKSSRF